MIEVGKLRFNTTGPCFPNEHYMQYLDSLNLTEAFMPVFDSDKTKSWDERIWREDRIVDGKTIHCYGV